MALMPWAGMLSRGTAAYTCQPVWAGEQQQLVLSRQLVWSQQQHEILHCSSAKKNELCKMPGSCQFIAESTSIQQMYSCNSTCVTMSCGVHTCTAAPLACSNCHAHACFDRNNAAAAATAAGARYNLRVRLYRPRSASLLQTFTSWLTGMPAEFSDPKFPSYGEGREGQHLPTI
jgi:hypothetical protein